MAQTVPQVQAFTNDNTGTSITVSFGSLPTVGNAARLMFSQSGGAVASVSDNQGGGNTWTQEISIQNSNSSSTRGYLFKCDKINTSAGTFTVTIPTTAGDYLTGALIEEAGSAQSSAVDKTATAETVFTAATSLTPTTAATTQANEIVYAMAGGRNNGGNPKGFALPGGYTQLFKQDNAAAHSAGIGGYKVVAATGVQNPTITWTANDDAVAFVATYKAATGSTAPQRRHRQRTSETGPYL
jgi:hypothetical protein